MRPRRSFFKEMSKWPRGQTVNGQFQDFNVQIPVIYKLPNFSPHWDNYHHKENENNATKVISTSDGECLTVYSEAQLQLLWQAFFLMGIEEDQETTYQTVAGKTFKVYSNMYNTALSTYSRMDHIEPDEIPDLANLSNFWATQEDRSIVIRALYELFPRGSTDGDGNVLREIPIDPEVAKIYAYAYGIKGELINGIRDMEDIRKILVDSNKISDETVMNNVVFPPATLVSPEWFQYPLSGYAKGRSALSVLTGLCENFKLHDVHLAIENTGSAAYGVVVKMGIFKSATIPVVSSMNNMKLEILAKSSKN